MIDIMRFVEDFNKEQRQIAAYRKRKLEDIFDSLEAEMRKFKNNPSAFKRSVPMVPASMLERVLGLISEYGSAREGQGQFRDKTTCYFREPKDKNWRRRLYENER
jgi:hypothetical protein